MRQSLEASGQTLATVFAEETKGSVKAAISAPESVSGASDSYPREATADEIAKLRHVAEKVPAIVWLVAFTGAAQRLAFYATTVPWRKMTPVLHLCDAAYVS